MPEFTLLGKTWCSVEIDNGVLETSDCVLILTDHSCYNWEMISKRARMVLDTRNVINGVSSKGVYKL